ncbi:MAG TPA: hypothetical protein DDW50_05355 [Firmicutes bacterium]|jgi:hypothetical protein|nr:hypothetical protein [Bacillota bacterium]
MGLYLEQWIFLAEQKENGNPVRYVKNRFDMKIYRFEPILTKLTAIDAGKFRRDIHERCSSMECFNVDDTGILVVYGAYFQQGLFWLGWEARMGESLFTSLKCQVSFDLEPILTGLYPLIQAYFHYHQAGLLVGRPDWGRLFYNSHGIYMVDPLYMPYLPEQPNILPLGLEHCRPPEIYNGSKLKKNGDLFYLGLIIYLAITAQLPYAIHDRWPTQALLKGDIIPPVIYRQDLHPLLAEKIKDLLNPDPEKRGTIQQLEAFWHLMLEQKSFLAPAQAQVYNTKEQKKFQRKVRWQKIGQPMRKVIAVLAFLIVLGLLFESGEKVQQSKEPFITVQKFYQTAAGPPQVQTAGLQGDSSISGDFTRARSKRLKTAAELLNRPLAEIEQTRLISRTQRRAVMEVLIRRWEWLNENWQSHLSREQLILENKGNQWFIQNRKTDPE